MQLGWYQDLEDWAHPLPARYKWGGMFAGMAELVDARDLGSRDFGHGGSTPSTRIIQHSI